MFVKLCICLWVQNISCCKIFDGIIDYPHHKIWISQHLYLTYCLCVLHKVLKGDEDVDTVEKNQDRWIVLFTRDPTVSDLFTLVPDAGFSGDKGEKNPQLNRSFSGCEFSAKYSIGFWIVEKEPRIWKAESGGLGVGGHTAIQVSWPWHNNETAMELKRMQWATVLWTLHGFTYHFSCEKTVRLIPSWYKNTWMHFAFCCCWWQAIITDPSQYMHLRIDLPSTCMTDGYQCQLLEMYGCYNICYCCNFTGKLLQLSPWNELSECMDNGS